MIAALGRIITWTLAIGVVGFSIGFFGPMILWPESNQGPLAGFIYTGPWGIILGFVVGVFRELLNKTASPIEVARSVNWKLALRVVAIAAGVLFVIRGTEALIDGVGRAAAAAIVIGVVCISYGFMGRVPSWFARRRF